MVVSCEPQKDRNSFLSVTLDGDGTVLGRRKVPLTLIANFEWHKIGKAQVGLRFACIKGILKECTASVEGKKIDEVKVKIQRRKRDEVSRSKNGTCGLGTNAKVVDARINGAQGRTEENILKEEYEVKHITFKVFAGGDKPELHFKPEPGKCFLDKPRSTKMVLAPDKVYSNAQGVFFGETLKYLDITDLNGKPLSLVKRWITLARIKKEYDTKDVSVGFRLVEK